MTTHDYIIRGGDQGKARLNILAGVLHDHTLSLLEANGLNPGCSFLDLGCGGGNVSIMAAKIVGDSGKVVGVDFDAEIIALAQKDANADHLTNVSFSTMSAGDINFDKEFDIAYARFLLSHLSNPVEVLQKMNESVKPGGKIIVEDVQFSGHFCHPSCTAFDNYVHHYTEAAKQNGADANIGPSLFSMFLQAGIEEIGFDMIQPCFNTGPGKWMACVTLDTIRPALITNGIATAAEIDDMLHELEQFTKDEQTIISLPRIFRVWGVKK